MPADHNPTHASTSVPASSAPTDAALPAPTIYDARDLATRSRDEWVLSNGIGGFAMGTASGIPERRYHALLIAATTPPVGRIAAVQSFVEWIVIEHAGTLTRLAVSAMRYADGTLSPAGAPPVSRFAFAQSCTWTMRVPAATSTFVVERELVLHRDRNAATVRYRVTREGAASATARVWLEARPLVSLRDFHATLTPGAPHGHAATNPRPDGVTVHHAGVALELRTDVSKGRFAPSPETWRNIAYTREHERGMDHIEDLTSPGVFILPLEFAADARTPWLPIVCEVPTPTPTSPVPDADAELSRERARVARIVGSTLANLGPKATPRDVEALRALAVAGDRFVVSRHVAARAPEAGREAEPGAPSVTMATVIAGYPWFADWGRDTCIAMPGLLLRCGRTDEARQCLAAFAAYRRRGLVPCTFDDGAGTPQYNTVDASLWFIHAACDYLRTTGDRAGFDAALRPACLEIVEHYRKGTDFSIRVDPSDGLVMAGNAQTQLTWMDAKRDGVVFTPRFGKPVEISALWYSALLELSGAIESSAPKAARELQQWADQAGRSFAPAFWNAEKRCLFDALAPTPSGGWVPVADVRPNQVFAIALPHSPLSAEQQRDVLAAIRAHLLTREGLRTLDAANPAYRARFEGVLFERDRAYHNGTVWPWLLGPYVDAVLRVGKRSAAAYAEGREAIRGMVEELARSRAVPGPVATLAEVYDADALPAPAMSRRPEGCLAQAWSVAEVIRAIVALSHEP
jgi:glycogen debranching enzyme